MRNIKKENDFALEQRCLEPDGYSSSRSNMGVNDLCPFCVMLIGRHWFLTKHAERSVVVTRVKHIVYSFQCGYVFRQPGDDQNR